MDENRLVQNFPEGLYFQLKASSDQDVQKVFLLYGSEGRSCQEGGARQELEFDPGAEVDLSWEWDFTQSGTLPSGAQIWWQWEITDASGSTLLTEKQTTRLQDQRNAWRQLSRDGVTVQWYEGSQGYGAQLLNIALRSLERLEKDAGLRPEGEVWITIYPSFEKLRQAQKASVEWTGGTAYTDHNAILLAVPQGEMDWAGEVIPHELAHLVSEAVVFNCRGAWLPTWLEEGLAEYAASPISEKDLVSLEKADQEGELPPLRSLERGFSAYSDQASLAYVQSSAVVAFLLETYPPEKLAQMIAVIKDGNLSDDALQQVYGFDTLGLDNAWREAMGYTLLPETAPTSTPDAAPTRVPTLALWTSAARPSPTATATLTSTPIPTYTPTPSQPPAAQPTVEAAEPTPDSTRSTTSTPLLWLAILAAVLLLGIAAGFIVGKRRRKT